ncbi:hypothetical protein A3K82_03720 [Candidatus Pacearchaeota archaeon RBG_19FT_COMBO_34_9]|nr:MAG: hypothetical protein A3K82_03720 [Candidatus Pacearchaeota archaeon RBG_19FT_COMBO_34_9]OGJ16136.1 MAG: hypothetical protein A3K74_02805 [Candidatus Pacearchaeota archaeon RBG_13_33_26]
MVRAITKKAQLKIQQMTFMLVAVTFLFILVGVFFLSIKLFNLRKTATILEEENAMLLVSKLANSPEFSCGNSFGSKSNCVDFDKLMVLRERMSEYSEFWGVAKIEVRKVYPDEGNILCNEETYPDCGIIRILDRKVNAGPATSNFVSLCRKEVGEKMIYDKCELARLLVSSEVKG